MSFSSRKLKSTDINGGHFVRTSGLLSTSLVLSVWDEQNEKCVHFNIDVHQKKVIKSQSVLMMGCGSVELV